jgi:choice-of-anchor B domain-containing protein
MKQVFLMGWFLWLFCPFINGQIAQRIKLLNRWEDEGFPFWYGRTIYNEVWGFVYKGEEYGVIGHRMGTTICRITNDDKLEHIQTIRGSAIEDWTVIHRDYHDYKGYLYEVCDESTSTLRIYDLSYLPDSVHIVYDKNELILRCHNIFIDTASAILYACGVTDGIGDYGLRLLSLSNPIEPQLIYDYPFVNYVHDAYVRNDTAFLNCAFQGLRVVNFSNPTMPLPLGTLSFYPDLGYNHSGWWSEDGKTYVMCDETSGMRFKVLDVSDLTDIKVASMAKPPTFAETMPHNVMLKDGLAYFSYYNDGLQVYDVRQTQSPKRIAYYDTYDGEDGPTGLFNGAWGVYAFLPSGRLLVSDRTYGLHLMQYDAPPWITPQDNAVHIYPNPAMNGSVYFYLAHRTDYPYTFQVLDASGRLIMETDTQGDYLKIDVQQWSAGVYIYRYYAAAKEELLQGKFVVGR